MHKCEGEKSWEGVCCYNVEAEKEELRSTSRDPHSKAKIQSDRRATFRMCRLASATRTFLARSHSQIARVSTVESIPPQETQAG